MQKLKFSKDQGTLFYQELKERIDAYFRENNIPRTGNHIMVFKTFLYFGPDILFIVY